MNELVINTRLIKDAGERMLTMDEYIWLCWQVNRIDLDLKVNLGKLVRLGYLDSDFSCTDRCLELLPEDAKGPVKVERFEEFWNLYPAHDGVFNHTRTRTLKGNKAATREEYARQAAIHGEDFMLEALGREIDDRLNNSTKKNAFTYMKSSLNYLKDKAFLQYAEI